VRLRHRVRAATVGEGLDHLAAGHDERGQQDDDRAGYRKRIAQPGRPGRDQDDEDRLWAVGDRREGVERQRGQSLDGGQPMSLVIFGNGVCRASQNVIQA